MKPPKSPRSPSVNRRTFPRKGERSSAARRFRPHLEWLEDRRVLSGVSFLTAPVIPVIDQAMQANLLAIHAEGMRLGNHDYAFSRVGDSITVTGSFLTDLGSPAYDLADPAPLGGHADLAPTIAYFRSHGVDNAGDNSFNHVSNAASPGWMSQTLLSGLPGLSPLTLEFATTHPALALVMIGTNDAIAGVDPAVFRSNLTGIAETAISMGVIPVLSTIPDNAIASGALEPRVLVFNQVIADVATELDVPLWNYWQALQALPGEGIQPGGAHPTDSPLGSFVFTDQGLLSGFNVRNFTALEVLGELRREVLHVSDASIPVPAMMQHPSTITRSFAALQIPAARLSTSVTVAALTPQTLVPSSSLVSTASVAAVPQAVPQGILTSVGSGGGSPMVAQNAAQDTAPVLTPPQPRPMTKPELLPLPTPVEEHVPDIITVGAPSTDLASDALAPVLPAAPNSSDRAQDQASAPDEGSTGSAEEIIVAGIMAAWAGRPDWNTKERRQLSAWKCGLINSALSS